MNKTALIVAPRLLIAALALSGAGGVASAGIKVDTTCQKNLDDGRILVEDYKTLPSEDSTFKVLKFKAERSEDEWAYGPCLLDATR